MASLVRTVVATVASAIGGMMIMTEDATAQSSRVAGPTSRPASLGTAWGDLGDGTYANPILPGDFSDLDAIRVGDDYYAMSSTFHYSPGVVILHSKDLVNWRILSHAVDDVTRIGPEMNWDRMDRYGRGVWAGSMRHHAGRFRVYFGTPEEGFFMTPAENPAGPWEPLHQVMAAKGWDDCCPFWDDDGQGYFVATHFADRYKIHLFKLTPDGKGLEPGFDKVLYSSKGSEASKLYKIDGTYYHYFSEVHGGGRREVMMRRAKSLDGPWETRQLNRVDSAIDREPNQGGLIQVPSGDWWLVTHHGTGAWEGRTMSLLPLTWVDGWPILGKVEADGVGTMVWQARKPFTGKPTTRPQTDDDFDAPTLAVQWEWNYQPRDATWSLTERPGFLRLRSFKPLRADDLAAVGNMLTQRSFKTAANEVTVKLDVSGMRDGDEAGLSHFARAFATVGVSQSGGVRRIMSNENRKIGEGPTLDGTDVWLRTTWGHDAVSRFSYSPDGVRFTEFGRPYTLVWKDYRGDRTGIFHYNRDGEGGHVDVDWYRYRMAGPGRKTEP
jgi:beta-xylosidase